MIPEILAAAFVLALVSTSVSHAASIIVAASNSSPESKERADFICDGTNDQVKLLESITRASRVTTKVDTAPAVQKSVECYGRHSVEWVPGDYYLGETLTIPDAADVAIHAEGTYFHYIPKEGDAVVVTGMNRCRYYFGTIESNSAGAAILVKPTAEMPALMSFLNFTGLLGSDQRGTGLYLDSTQSGVCCNRFEGTDIMGFDTGVFVSDAIAKCDTNWFWFSYIRMCNTGIQELGKGVDDNVWNVNVDASIPDSLSLRTAATHGKWYVIMGTWTFEGVNNAVILDPGASQNVIEVHPPLEDFAWEDNSGNNTNIILTAKRYLNAQCC
ncbi:MAG: hypothetical protein OXP71_00140 [Candidatus Poribacteria bacterium]|nr:hypothetical protein [Candidatus Poribacteria bacterium]